MTPPLQPSGGLVDAPTRPAGKSSTNCTPVNGTSGFGLVMVNVRLTGTPRATVVAPKLFVTVGVFKGVTMMTSPFPERLLMFSPSALDMPGSTNPLPPPPLNPSGTAGLVTAPPPPPPK